MAMTLSTNTTVILANAGIHEHGFQPVGATLRTFLRRWSWIPAFAGMTMLVGAGGANAQLPKARIPIAAPDAGTASGDAQAIIAVIDQLSAGMRAKDSAVLGALFVPDAALYSVRDNPDGTTTARRTALAEWLAQIGGAKETIEERIGRPDITIAGAAASVSAPYTLHLGGKLHHCGTDFFHFVRTQAGWKVTSITYNSTTDGCTP
jgi:ketosteroid isomerase-like protein